MAPWSNWTWGQKKPFGGFFLLKFSVKKIVISCNVFKKTLGFSFDILIFLKRFLGVSLSLVFPISKPF
jgi:hypothetical protein